MASNRTRHGATPRTRRPAPGTERVGRSSSRTPAARPGRPAGGPRAARIPFDRRLAPLAFLVLLLFVAWAFYPVAKVHYGEQREKARLESELQALRARNADLRQQVDRLKSPEGLEDVARRKLGYVREGEHAYVVTDWQSGEDTAAALGRAKATTEPPETLMYRVLDVFFGVGG